MAVVLDDHTGINTACPAEQAGARARLELIGCKLVGSDDDLGRSVGVGNRHGPLTRAKATLAGAHLKFASRPRRRERRPNCPAMALTFVDVGGGAHPRPPVRI